MPATGQLEANKQLVLDYLQAAAEPLTPVFMVAEDDPRLPPGAIVLGGYAVPVAGDFA